MKQSALFFLVCGLLVWNQAVYAARFNLAISIGGPETAFPPLSHGMIVVDGSGDGFDFLTDSKLLQGARFKTAGTLLGDDDVILVAGLRLQDLGSSQRGFVFDYSTVNPVIGGTQQALSGGRPMALVWFPGGNSNPGDTFRFFRSSSAAPGLPGSIAFLTPEAGHTSALIALSETLGGHVSGDEFSAQSGVIEAPGPINVDWNPIFAKILQGEVGSLQGVMLPEQLSSYVVFNLAWTKIKPRLQAGLTLIATVSGRITLGGVAYTVSGSLSDGGLLTLNLKSRTQQLQTQLEWNTEGPMAGFFGQISTPLGVLPLSLVPNANRGTLSDSSPHFGKAVNVVLLEADDSPAIANFGHGFLRAIMNRNGSASLSGRLPDGTAFTATARGITDSSGQSRLYFHRVLPSKLGHLLGDFFLPLSVDSSLGELDLTGSMTWLKAQRPKSLFHPAAMTARFEARGIRWLKPTVSLFTSSPGQSFTVSFDPLNHTIAGAYNQPGVWNDANKPFFVLPPAGTTFTFTASTGLFSGTRSYIQAGRSLKASHRGIMLPRPIPVYLGDPPLQGFGYMLTPSESGIVEIKPATP